MSVIRGSVGAVRLALLVLVAGLCACSAPPAARNDGAAAREFAARGYAAPEPDEVTTSLHAWPLAGQVARVQLAAPRHAGALPLVVYLPGLGEAADAGSAWRMAWAAAGYAVLSVQALDEDAGAWASALARSGEFKALGRERYAGAAAAQRLQRLRGVLDEARRRSASGDAAWQRVDWTRVAVAGFDLGAYTAMTLAGEQVPGTEALAGLLPLRAVIALSPFATVAQGGLATRYAGIRGPVLSVTSDVDGDALGLVDSAALRTAPFENMPGPDKYLLQLSGMAHAALAGPGTSGAVPSEAAVARAPERAERPDSDGSGVPRRGGGGGRQRGGNEGARPQRSGAGPDARNPLPQAGGAQVRRVAVEEISTAFLDAYVRDDAAARAWLAGEAPRWLGATGALRSK